MAVKVKFSPAIMVPVGGVMVFSLASANVGTSTSMVLLLLSVLLASIQLLFSQRSSL